MTVRFGRKVMGVVESCPSRLVFAAIVCALGLSACTATTEDTHHLKNVQIGQKLPGVAVDAKQRFVWSPARRSGSTSAPIDQLICAEPSPDAMSQLASAFAIQAQIQTKGVEAGGSLQKSFTEAVTNIGKRTVTIQLLRDGMYRACEAYANGLIEEFGYNLILNAIDNVMVQLVALETLGQGAAPVDPADNIKIADAASKQAEVKTKQGKLSAALALVLRREQEEARARDSVTKANAALIAAKTEKAGVDQQIMDLDGKTDDNSNAQRLNLKRQQAALAGEIAGREKLKENADSTLQAATNNLNSATTAVGGAESELTEAKAAGAAAQELAEKVVKKLPGGSASAILEVVKSSDTLSTVVGACMAWLAGNDERKNTKVGTECVDFLNLAQAKISASK